MKITKQGTKERYIQIIEWIPVIKKIISLGGKWEQLKGICEPLDLTDTAFRDYPKENDFLLDINFWIERIINLNK